MRISCSVKFGHQLRPLYVRPVCVFTRMPTVSQNVRIRKNQRCRGKCNVIFPEYIALYLAHFSVCIGVYSLLTAYVSRNM